MDIIKATEQTLNILRDVFYFKDGEKTVLSKTPNDFNAVKIITPDFVSSCLKKVKGGDVSGCKIVVDANDSFASAKINGQGKTLVLNFASAYYPGGGFLEYSPAQEESLCRCSTLYASLSSPEAETVYAFNRSHIDPQGSKYMLISKDVFVFRQAEGLKLLKKPFKTDVITFAAPNLFCEARTLNKEDVQSLFLDKIKELLCVAAVEKYDSLILGAWGCGAFGNDAKDVAGYFYRVLITDGLACNFKKVVFSVYVAAGKRSTYNYEAFKEIFG